MRDSLKPDYRRIHELEYELGFRDDPPPSRAQSAATGNAIVKDMWTDVPGTIVTYNPRKGRLFHWDDDLWPRS